MRRVAPTATQIFLFGILLVYFKKLDGFIFLCPASSINCRRNINSPNYDNVYIPEIISNSIEFLKLSILKLWSRLIQSNPHEYLDEMGSHEKLLKKLYKSSNVLQVAPKAKMTRNEGTQTLEVQKDLTSEILEVSSDIRLRPKSHLQGLKNHQNTIQRDHWLQIRKSKGKTHELEIQKETRTDISEAQTVKRWPKVTLKEKIRENTQKTHELEIQKEVSTDISEALNVKKWLKMTPKEKIRGKKEKTQDLEVQKDAPTDISEGQMVKRWPKLVLKEKIRKNTKKTHELEIQKEVSTDISEAQMVKRWPKVTLKEKIREKTEKTHQLEVQKEAPTDISEELKEKRCLKVSLTGKIRGNRKKTHMFRVQKEAPTKMSESLKIKRWPNVTLKEIIRENKGKTHELKTQKEMATDIFEALKVIRWPKVTLKEKIRENKGNGHELKTQKEMATDISEDRNVKRCPKVTLKEKIRGKKEKTRELEIQKEVATEISETLSEIRLKTKNPVKRLKWHQRKIQEDLEVGRNEREKTGKPVALLDAQEVSSLKRLAQASVHSLQKRSILHLPTQLPPLTSSVVVHDGGEEQPGKVVFVLKSGKRSARPSHVKNIGITEQAKETNTQNEQIAEKHLAKQLKSQESRKEKLLRHLIITGSNSRITTEKSTTLKKLLPDEPHWKHHGHSTSAPPSFDFLSTSNNFLLRRYAFESEWKKTLASIFPNKILRNIIAKFMRVLKIDCKEPITKKSCPELIHKMGRFLIKFTTSADMERLSVLKTLPAKNENNIPSTSSRKMEKPPDKIAKQRILQRIGRNGKLIYILLALSVTMFIMIIIIAVLFIIKIYSHQIAKGMEGTPLEKW